MGRICTDCVHTHTHTHTELPHRCNIWEWNSTKLPVCVKPLPWFSLAVISCKVMRFLTACNCFSLFPSQTSTTLFTTERTACWLGAAASCCWCWRYDQRLGQKRRMSSTSAKFNPTWWHLQDLKTSSRRRLVEISKILLDRNIIWMVSDALCVYNPALMRPSKMWKWLIPTLTWVHIKLTVAHRRQR